MANCEQILTSNKITPKVRDERIDFIKCWLRILKMRVHFICKIYQHIRVSLNPTYGIKHDGNILIKRTANIWPRENIKFGKNCFVNHNCSFYLGGGHCIIHDNVFFGMNVVMTCITHNIGCSESRATYKNEIYKNIEIGCGTWIGANCTILPGVKIGNGCVIAAGSVVNKDIPNNVMVGGVPAKIIKKLNTTNNEDEFIPSSL